MKKRIFTILSIIVLCMALIPAVLAAETDDAKTIRFTYSAPYDTVNRATFDIGAQLPADAKVTDFKFETPSIIQAYTHTWTVDGNNVSLGITTKVYDDVQQDTVTGTVKTSNYGNYSIIIDITLTGKYKVTISAEPLSALYNGQPCAGCYNIVGALGDETTYAGAYLLTYATSEGTPLSGAPSEPGEYTVTIGIDAANETYYCPEPVTLPFSILTEPEAEYQRQENGAWVQGSFADAVAEVYAGGTIRLLRDVTLKHVVMLDTVCTITSRNAAQPCKLQMLHDGHGYVLYVTSDVTLTDVIVDGGSESGATALRAAVIVKGGNLTLDTGAVIRNNNNVFSEVLDVYINGQAYKRYEGGAGGGVYLHSGKLTMLDGAVICDNKVDNGFTGSNTRKGEGGGVFVYKGTFTLAGGVIRNNHANQFAGAVNTYNESSVFIMTGGTIEGNTSAKYGGGIYVSGRVDISGGKITGNHAAIVGGACMVDTNATLNLSGGEITGNSAVNFAGGIECSPLSYVNLSGAVVVKGNTSGEETDGGMYIDGARGYGWPDMRLAELDENADVHFYSYAGCDGFLIAKPATDYAVSDGDMLRMDYCSEEYALVRNDAGNVVLTNVQVYPITFDHNNGSGKAETYKAAGGTLPALPTAEPVSSYYRFDGWYTQAVGGEAVTVDTVYTEATTVYAHWMEIPPSVAGTPAIWPNQPGRENPFEDVTADDYFYDPVLWGAENGIVSGTDETHFSPKGLCTRAQLVVFLYRASGCPAVEREMNFTDVDANGYYAEAVRWAAANGIVTGYPDGSFRPNGLVTREQAAVILYRYAAYCGLDTTQGGMAVREFADYEAVSSYAVAAMQWAVNAGMMRGVNGALLPQGSASRAQLVTLLYRLIAE